MAEENVAGVKKSHRTSSCKGKVRKKEIERMQKCAGSPGFRAVTAGGGEQPLSNPQRSPSLKLPACLSAYLLAAFSACLSLMWSGVLKRGTAVSVHRVPPPSDQHHGSKPFIFTRHVTTVKVQPGPAL